MSRERSKDGQGKAIKSGLRLEIEKLGRELCNVQFKVTKRRETGKRLLELLSKERNRNRLIEEMVEIGLKNGLSPAKARRQAHPLVWGPIIKSAFYGAQSLVEGGGKKSKLDPDDVKLPLKILHYSDMSAEGEGNQTLIESTNKMNSKEVHLILKFCFEMLENDQVRDIAETELMNTLVYMCERVDYVAHLRPENDVLRIMATVEAVLKVNEGQSALAAARIFGAILESCIEIGMGLFLVVNRSIKLVSKWCHRLMEHASKNPRELGYLFRGITAVVRFHPEQSIRPLHKYGRVLLQFAKRSYLTAPPNHKHVIHGYLIAHIIVNQKAGELRGLLPGELGDLGKATLNAEQLEHLLPMVLSSLSRVELTLSVKKRLLWKTLDVTVRRHLECCARFLACAQRQFLVEEEWKLLDNPDDFFTGMVRELSRDKNNLVGNPSITGYPTCTQHILAESPWTKHILKPLLYMLREVKTSSNAESFSPSSTQVTGLETSPPVRYPLLDYIYESESMKAEMDLSKSSVLLLVISACAEAFPSGRCWGSSSHKHWFTLRPDDKQVEDLFHVNGSSISDLALLVHVVTNVLEASSGSAGDPEVQMLALLCLLRLTGAHSALVSLIEIGDMSDLAASWRQAWSLLTRPDLRLAASTAHASTGSCGELVLVLLTEMVQCWCTDPSMMFSHSIAQKQSTFLYRKQFQIWALPVFGLGASLNVKQAFELVCAFLHRTCLSEEGRDGIPKEALVMEEGSSNEKGPKVPDRRYRLVCLCLHALDSLHPVKSNPNGRQVAMAVTACLSALVNGKISCFNRTFLDESQNLIWMRSSTMDGFKNTFCFTEMTGAELPASKPLASDARNSLFRLLWTSPILDPGASSLQQLRWDESKSADCVLAEKLKLYDLFQSIDASTGHVDYVPVALSISYYGFLQSQLKDLLTRWTADGGEDAPAQADSNNSHMDAQDPLMSASCLWLKISLGIDLLVDDDKVPTRLEQLEEKLLLTFEKVGSDLSNLCDDRDEFQSVFLDLLQIIRFLTELSSTLSIEMSPTLRGGLSAFLAVCESLLLSFGGDQPDHAWDEEGGDESQSASSSNESEDLQIQTKVLDLLSDSDSDEVVNKRKLAEKKKSSLKSKRRKRQDNTPRRKKKKRHPKPPDASCACIVGSILVTLQPSVARCESVVDCLLRKGSSDSEVDLAEAFHCLILLSDSSVFIHENAVGCLGESISTANAMDESFRQQSLVSLICTVVQKFRASASVASSLHMFGFQLYSECARLGENDLRVMKLTMDESKQIAEPLLESAESLQSRPYLRLDRLRAATDAYLLGGDNIHVAMEKFKTLVVASLNDLCPLVRYYSCRAAGAALHILSNKEAIVKTVSSRLPPVGLPNSPRKGKQRTYPEWYQNFDLGTGDIDAENDVWNDAMMSMERSAVKCRSVLAGVDADFSADIVYDMIKIASSRPELEATCFHACEKIALMLGYLSAEDYLDDMSESLLGKWLENGETLGGTPLLLSSPGLIWLLLRVGQQPFVHVERPLDRTDSVIGNKLYLNGTHLEDVATDEYVARHKAYIIPRMLLRICSSEDAEKVGSMAKIAGDSSFQELCISLKGKHDDATIKAVIQGGLHDIEAICAPMDQGELETLKQKIQKLVSDVLSTEDGTEADRKMTGKPHLTTRRILELSGKDSREMFPAHLVQEAFLEAILGFLDKLKPKKNGDSLSAAGTSLTECFLYARQWLERATLQVQKEMRWKTMTLLFDLIFKQIHCKEYRHSQLLFGVNILVDVLLDSSLSCIHSKALRILDQILEEVVASVVESDVLKKEFSMASKRLLGSLMKIHEESQQELLSFCKCKATRRHEILLRSIGLLGKEAGSSDTWGWDSATAARSRHVVRLETALKEFHNDVNQFLIQAITGTYDLLQKCFDFSSVLGLKPEYFVGCMPPFSVSLSDQEALASTNPRLCAQKVALGFAQRNQFNQAQYISQSIQSLLGELINRSSWMDSLSGASRTHKLPNRATAGHQSSTTLSMSQWMLRAALVQLEHQLREDDLSKELGLCDGDLMKLVRELSFVCGASCPKELRLAASRCLGELDPKLIYKEPSVQLPGEHDRIQKSLDDDDLLRALRARAIEVLDEYLHSRNSGVAIAAVDTLIALLATRDGSECWALLDTKVQERLLPVLSGKRRPLNVSKMSLSKARIASIRSKAGWAADVATESCEWCWEKGLWRCPADKGASFENWICDLVPALILCCYHDTINLQSSGAFFYVCQTMASIAPRFASAIFPAIVLDRLEKSADAVAAPPSTVSSIKIVAQETWICPADSKIREQLSSCFDTLLGQTQEGSTTHDGRAVALAIDTLDLLRRTTQMRFQKSESHKRNSNAMPVASSRNSKKASKGSRTSRSPKSPTDRVDTTDCKDEYNNGLGEVIPWKGVPFGTVLNLNGDLIVLACIRVQRYASALFYAELYFESCFAGSGAILERLANDFAGASARAEKFSKADISGYFVGAKECKSSVLRKRAVSSLKLLGEIYHQLNEIEAYQAAEKQSSDLRYSDCNALAIDNGEEGHHFVASLGELLRLDSLSNMAHDQLSTSLRTAEAIESLGLRNLLQSYIGSMGWSTVSSMADKDRRMLREKWFESRLYGMNWDNALLDCPEFEMASQTRGDLTASGRPPVLGETELSREDMGFHEAVTDALKAFAHDDMQTCLGIFRIARGTLLEPISALATIESSRQGMSTIVERLQFLNSVESLIEGSGTGDNLLKRWGFSQASEHLQAPTKPILMTDYTSAEFSPHMREALLRILRFKSSRQSMTEAFDPQLCLVEHLRHFARWCRQMSFLPTAESALQRLGAVLQTSSSSSGANSASWELVLGHRLEEAHLRASKGDFGTAVRVSKQVINLLNEEKKQRNGPNLAIDCIQVDALISCGGWLSKNKIEPARIILQSYHQPGADLAKKLLSQHNTPENGKRYLQAQLALARLASGLYDSISSRVRSPEWIKAGKSLAEREKELKHCEAMLRELRDKQQKASKKDITSIMNEQTELMHYGRQVKTEVNLALEERNKTIRALGDYLCLAVKSFASALSIGGVGEGMDMSRHVFRMVFLWLSNCSEGKENHVVNAVVDIALESIPSFRFVALTSQLFAQIDDKDNSRFQTTLHKLVEKMCRDHPYHCLVQLVSVCNGREVGEGVSGRSADFFLENMSQSKVDAAQLIARNLKKNDPSFVGELLENYQSLMSAYIALANASMTKFVENGKTKRIPLNQASKNQSLDRCLARREDCLPCVLTSPPPVRSGCDYGNGKEDPIGGERVKGFESTFSITDSGLHRPKIVICEGSKGGRFRQLVKGEDEIRQDAVMEQVFSYVNDLMRKDADNTLVGHGRNLANDLQMVTYNIIPLSPASGVLEWVENTMTFGDYILDNKTSKGYIVGSHSRYYPGEWGHSRCRQHYAKAPVEEKLETFETICRAFTPSFRFFFVERFGHSLIEWYQKKMKYTRSVAVSSIVGHILGIGDRHTNNILVSQISGEVVHIDFGIVFEQGKLLAVPELVPFRLTRNLIDGMGPTGTEGTFTRSAEATAVVLRENANALLTILSAIASDPLYRWSVSPVDARRRQRLDDNQPAAKGKINDRERSSMTASKSERNEAAALVLAKIQEKLQGYEDGTSGEQQGIEGQVQLLINSARDTANLSVMFAGWAPWV